jgi:hypothetical protein
MQTVHSETAVRSDTNFRTKEQRAKLLIKANILDNNGDYVEHFFSAETIKKDKARQQKK